MTAHTPASKASSVSTLLASLSSVPSPPQPPVKDDFFTVMMHALMDRLDGAEHPLAAQSSQQKSSLAPAVAPEPTAASLLLALLTPPSALVPKPTSHKASTSSVDDFPSGPAAQAAQEKTSPTEAASELTAASLLMALLAPPLLTLTKPPSHKASATLGPVVLSVPDASTAPAQATSEAKTDSEEKPPPLPGQVTPTKEPENKPPPISGTSAANLSSRMSSLSERNEIAGRTEQKLPPPAISAVSSADTGGSSPDSGQKSSLAFSWHDAPPEPLAIIELSAKAAVTVAPVADMTADVPVRVSSTAPLERLEQMISREVMSVRQAGAQTLGVTLKLDTDTQLFLQLTTNNGMVQASVRCERGSFAPEDGQWAQLQQSLARQNVELLPMTGGSNLNFQQPSQERSRHPATREDWPVAGAAVPPVPPRKQQKEQNRSRKNWESWA